MPVLQQGSIVWAEVQDLEGGNPKVRPVVILTPTHEIPSASLLVGAAITFSVPAPVPSTMFELPWMDRGHPVTGLNRRCVVVCNWLVKLAPTGVQRIGGIVPPDRLQRILESLPKEI